jgi:hypothetical protein
MERTFFSVAPESIGVVNPRTEAPYVPYVLSIMWVGQSGRTHR